jgi:hypothetical protein
MSTGPAATPAPGAARRFPPVAGLTTVSLALVVVGGILMASYAPRRAPLGVPVTLAVAGAALLLAGGYLTSRLGSFAWNRFFLVFRWALLAYAISAGMIAFAFIKDHVRGAPLAVVLVMLVIYALDVPLVIAFTAARYASPAGHAGSLPDLSQPA